VEISQTERLEVAPANRRRMRAAINQDHHQPSQLATVLSSVTLQVSVTKHFGEMILEKASVTLYCTSDSKI
jgi:hypothetical protein